MDENVYLERIGYRGPPEPTAETLRQLHRAHMLSVPFENLDILLGHPISLSLPVLYDKIVLRHRGGFCYELNGLFAWLLEQLGFTVRILSARVFDEAEPGPEFDHMVLLVELEERFIADVGFGDSFLEPLRLDTEDEDVQHGSSYRLLRSDQEDSEGSAWLLQRRRESDWEPQYVFSLTPHRLDEFSGMCRHYQRSPESIFTQKAVCSLATPGGRITLANNRLITTTRDRREERVVTGEEDYQVLLKKYFGMNPAGWTRIDRLLVLGTPGT